MGRLPPQPLAVRPMRGGRGQAARSRRAELEHTRANLAKELIEGIASHRARGRAALLVDALDDALTELWMARDLEHDLENLGAAAHDLLPPDWEMQTDLVPLARALSSRGHPRAPDIWRVALDDGTARSIQAEAVEWLARDAFGSGQGRLALRILHAGSLLGRKVEAEALRLSYKQAGLEPSAQFAHYLAAVRLEPHAARAADLRDPLTGRVWSDQDPRWWRDGLERALPPTRRGRETTVDVEHQREALSRAADLAASSRDHGWLLLAEGDFIAGPTGARVLGRGLRAGYADSGDHDLFMRVRLAYEGAADRLPDVAWPWYRLAEMLAWAGFVERAAEHLAQAERRKLGSHASDREQRPILRTLVQAALGNEPERAPRVPRPFPAAPHGPHLMWRLRLLPGA